MAKYKLLLPKMGESVAEATVIKWTKKPGDYIEADETVMEIATDKVDSDVPSPVAGKLLECLYKDNDVVQVGAVIAIIETAGPEEIAVPPVAAPVYQPAEEMKATAPETPRPEIKIPEETKPPVFAGQREELSQPVPYTGQLEELAAPKAENGVKSSPRFYSPLVKNIAAQEAIGNVELDQIPGTGAEGRLTKDDLLNYIQQKYQSASAIKSDEAILSESVEPNIQAPVAETHFAEPDTIPEPLIELTEPEPVFEIPRPEPAKPGPVVNTTSLGGGDEIIEMDRMRRLIAGHMVMSKQTSPHVTSFVEADVTNMVLWREKIKGSFEKREGEKITFTPIFIEAVVRAIKDLPMINIQVNGTQIIKKKDINISMATALPSGNLIVPVIKRADELSLIGLTKVVNDLANRARNNKLKPDDVQGGTFTITNVGSFGNVMGTPIINQPQVAILAVGAIRKKPAVIETLQGDMIGIRHMMFLSLSYDHRVVDGALGGTFVRRVADYLENWDPGREI
ncbi:MAG TPA: diapophytoene dehydrogenase [Mucilaginibacter sp.]|jgi:2-oxoglutarate dehydrogenase E2 component (dihydrolipoamide succinyltransferase)|nr:diapophytoene dehydrogenase [Mucilaginibacter sp.]